MGRKDVTMDSRLWLVVAFAAIACVVWLAAHNEKPQQVEKPPTEATLLTANPVPTEINVASETEHAATTQPPNQEQTPLEPPLPQADTAAAPVNPAVARLNALYSSLPLKGQLSEEPHLTPQAVVAAGERIGRLEADLQNDPQNVSSAMGFYDRCARGSEIVPAIRALCLSHLMRWSQSTGEAVDESQYPASIVRIARDLPQVY